MGTKFSRKNIKHPRISLNIVGLLMVFFVINHISGNFINSIVLRPSDLIEVNNWYRFITYALFSGDVFDFLWFVLPFISLSYVLEYRIARNLLLTIILSSVILYGLTFAFINYLSANNVALLGMGAVNIAYFTWLIILILNEWKHFSKAEKRLSWIAGIVTLISLTSFFERPALFLEFCIVALFNIVIYFIYQKNIDG